MTEPETRIVQSI